MQYIHKIIEVYARDFSNLKTHSALYPTPERLRAITRQGGTDSADLRGWGRPGEGSDWIIRCARRADPGKGSWGGHFVRARDRPRYVFRQAPTARDVVETFAILELHHHPSGSAPDGVAPAASLVVGRQEFPGFRRPDGTWIFLFSPKEEKTWSYAIKSNQSGLDGQTGGFTSRNPDPARATHPSPRHPNWWTDDPEPLYADGQHQGAKTVGAHREEFLRDFAARMESCRTKKP